MKDALQLHYWFDMLEMCAQHSMEKPCTGLWTGEDTLPVFTTWLDAKLDYREEQNVFQLDLFRREMDAVQPTGPKRCHVTGGAAADMEVGMQNMTKPCRVPLIRTHFSTVFIPKDIAVRNNCGSPQTAVEF